MPFVKLDCGMLTSSLWIDREARDIFITALLMAEPWEFLEPQAQISVRDLELTGWMMPPGWYGFARAAGIGIIHQAGMERESGMAALERLSSADHESRSHAFEGRRLVRIDGGYVVLNYMNYRERDETGAERMRRYRAKKKDDIDKKQALRVTGVTLRATVTQAEAEAEEDKREEGSPDGSPHHEKTDMNQKATEPSNLFLSLKKKKRTKTVYPSKHDLLKLWSLDYPAAHGGDSYHYVDTKDDKPVDDLLSRYSPAQIMERAQKGWESQKQFIRDNASTFYGLNRYWNEIGNETRGSSKPVPKLRKFESL